MSFMDLATSGLSWPLAEYADPSILIVGVFHILFTFGIVC
jgi:hypothetical protein